MRTAGTVRTLPDQPEWRKSVRRILYTSPQLRICRSPEASAEWQVRALRSASVPVYIYCDKSCGVQAKRDQNEPHDRHDRSRTSVSHGSPARSTRADPAPPPAPARDLGVPPLRARPAASSSSSSPAGLPRGEGDRGSGESDHVLHGCLQRSQFTALPSFDSGDAPQQHGSLSLSPLDLTFLTNF